MENNGRTSRLSFFFSIGVAASIAVGITGCAEPEVDEEGPSAEARSAVSFDWELGWGCDPIEPYTPYTVYLTTGDVTGLMFYAGEKNYEIRLQGGGTWALEEPLVVASNTWIHGVGMGYPEITVSAGDFTDKEDLIDVEEAEHVRLEHLKIIPVQGGPPDVSAGSGVAVRGSNHVHVDDVVSMAIQGSTYRVVNSFCTHLSFVYAEEVDYFPDDPPGCATTELEGTAVNIVSSSQVLVEGATLVQTAKAGITAVDSSDIAVVRCDLSNIGAGACNGAGVGIAAKLSPSITGADFNLWVDALHTGIDDPAEVHGLGIFVDATDTGGDQLVFLENNEINVFDLYDGICVDGGSTANGSDIRNNTITDGNIHTDLSLSVASKASNTCDGMCAFTLPCDSAYAWW